MSIRERETRLTTGKVTERKRTCFMEYSVSNFDTQEENQFTEPAMAHDHKGRKHCKWSLLGNWCRYNSSEPNSNCPLWLHIHCTGLYTHVYIHTYINTYYNTDQYNQYQNIRTYECQLIQIILLCMVYKVVIRHLSVRKQLSNELHMPVTHTKVLELSTFPCCET